MKEADLENSLHPETRSMNLQTALEPKANTAEGWTVIMRPPHKAWTHKTLHPQCEIETNTPTYDTKKIHSLAWALKEVGKPPETF